MGRTRDVCGIEWHQAWSPRYEKEAVGVAELPVLQRLLLTTDGTMTTALATLLGEPIGVRLLHQDKTMLAQDDEELSLREGREVIERRALLHGAESRTPLLLGVSRIAVHRLPREARAALIDGVVPIGLLLRSHEIETFRAPLSIGVRRASDEAARYLGDTPMCWRRYLIKADRRPLMSVDEQFPAAGFAARQ
ncbi:MAG TPA: chorismate pyruvate-lyase family protein [Solirubrobacteraceae bacterium]|jgi:chorismate-pyruvate lyase